MNQGKKKPRMLRIASSFFRAPERFDALIERLDRLDIQLDALHARTEEAEHRAEEARQHIESVSQIIQDIERRMNRDQQDTEDRLDGIKYQVESVRYRLAEAESHTEALHNETLKNVGDINARVKMTEELAGDVHRRLGMTEELAGDIHRRLGMTENRIFSLGKQIDDSEASIRDIWNGEEQAITQWLGRLAKNHQAIKDLNRELSIHPTIWGDESRLHIASTANVNACMLHTNSGSITVGEYTFAGSNVSILAGTHDLNLTGLPRRDADITSGCDISIGNGVWLASGSTILGPCSIGDNAVIAAGAVVTPGTNVPPNTVYAGVPAREINKITPASMSNVDDPAVKNAMDRNRGVLFTVGWSEKTAFEGLPCFGYYLEKESGKVLCRGNQWRKTINAFK